MKRYDYQRVFQIQLKTRLGGYQLEAQRRISSIFFLLPPLRSPEEQSRVQAHAHAFLLLVDKDQDEDVEYAHPLNWHTRSVLQFKLELSETNLGGRDGDSRQKPSP